MKSILNPANSKSLNFTFFNIFINMGRPKKNESDKKIKVGICLDRQVYNLLMINGGKPSRIIEKILIEHCEQKNLY